MNIRVAACTQGLFIIALTRSIDTHQYATVRYVTYVHIRFPNTFGAVRAIIPVLRIPTERVKNGSRRQMSVIAVDCASSSLKVRKSKL